MSVMTAAASTTNFLNDAAAFAVAPSTEATTATATTVSNDALLFPTAIGGSTSSTNEYAARSTTGVRRADRLGSLVTLMHELEEICRPEALHRPTASGDQLRGSTAPCLDDATFAGGEGGATAGCVGDTPQRSTPPLSGRTTTAVCPDYHATSASCCLATPTTPVLSQGQHSLLPAAISSTPSDTGMCRQSSDAGTGAPAATLPPPGAISFSRPVATPTPVRTATASALGVSTAEGSSATDMLTASKDKCIQKLRQVFEGCPLLSSQRRRSSLDWHIGTILQCDSMSDLTDYLEALRPLDVTTEVSSQVPLSTEAVLPPLPAAAEAVLKSLDALRQRREAASSFQTIPYPPQKTTELNTVVLPLPSSAPSLATTQSCGPFTLTTAATAAVVQPTRLTSPFSRKSLVDPLFEPLPTPSSGSVAPEHSSHQQQRQRPAGDSANIAAAVALLAKTMNTSIDNVRSLVAPRCDKTRQDRLAREQRVWDDMMRPEREMDVISRPSPPAVPERVFSESTSSTGNVLQRSMKGVSFDRSKRNWEASWLDARTGRRVKKCFSEGRWGSSARDMAIMARKEAEDSGVISMRQQSVAATTNSSTTLPSSSSSSSASSSSSEPALPCLSEPHHSTSYRAIPVVVSQYALDVTAATTATGSQQQSSQETLPRLVSCSADVLRRTPTAPVTEIRKRNRPSVDQKARLMSLLVPEESSTITSIGNGCQGGAVLHQRPLPVTPIHLSPSTRITSVATPSDPLPRLAELLEPLGLSLGDNDLDVKRLKAVEGYAVRPDDDHVWRPPPTKELTPSDALQFVKDFLRRQSQVTAAATGGRTTATRLDAAATIVPRHVGGPPDLPVQHPFKRSETLHNLKVEPLTTAHGTASFNGTTAPLLMDRVMSMNGVCSLEDATPGRLVQSISKSTEPTDLAHTKPASFPDTATTASSSTPGLLSPRTTES